jgi:hypothetical protein
MYKDKKVTAVDSIKFLGLTLDNSLSWEKHVEAIIPKLSAATFALRVVQPLLSLDSLKLIYYSYFHSILSYGIIFWGNTPHSNVMFKIQKKIVRIMTGIRNGDFCREYIKRFVLLSVLLGEFVIVATGVHLLLDLWKLALVAPQWSS